MSNRTHTTPTHTPTLPDPAVPSSMISLDFDGERVYVPAIAKLPLPVRPPAKPIKPPILPTQTHLATPLDTSATLVLSTPAPEIPAPPVVEKPTPTPVPGPAPKNIYLNPATLETDSEKASAVCAAAEEIVKLADESGQPITAAAITQDHKLDAYRRLDSMATIASTDKTATAIHITALLSEYDMAVVQNAQQIRNLCTNLLLDKAAHGKTEQIQLRAVEMLGKIKDVALFEERSSVLVEHMTTEDIQKALREKINNIRSRVIDVTPRATAQAVSDVIDGKVIE